MSDVSGFGAYLRKRREEKGLTLQDVAERTKIQLRYLEAIEAGDFHSLPGPAYVRGFLRLYAIAVGMDPERVVQAFAQTEAAKAHGNAAGEPETERPESRQAGRNLRAWDFAWLVAFLTLLGATATWLTIRAGM